MVGIPPVCPRCGNEQFEDDSLYRKFGSVKTWKEVQRCTQCLLAFDGDTWWDQRGQQWTMAESGE